ncbi:MAG: hypothetical protein ACRDZP_05830 [Acidimicrobiales bacterium]
MTPTRTPGYRVRQLGVEPEAVSGAGGGATEEGAASIVPTAAGSPSADPPDSGSPSAGSRAGGDSGENLPAGRSPAVRGAPSGGAPAAASRTPRDRRLIRLLALVAALGVAGTVGFAVAWGTKSSGGPTAEVSSGARNVVLALTNFDPGTVSADFSQIEQDSTGTFATQAKKYFGTSIRKELAAAHAASRGKIVDLYVQSVNGNQASVFAVVNQTYLNSNAKSPVTDVLRLALGMTDVSGTWKASSVEVLQQPAGSSSSGSTPGG